MKYIAVIHKDKDSAYGAALPDFPGCFSAADSIEDLQANIQEAVELYAEDLEDFEPPVPASAEAVKKSDETGSGILMLVEIDFSFLEKKAVPVNITMPLYMKNRIDRYAKAKGLTRSAYLLKAAEAFA